MRCVGSCTRWPMKRRGFASRRRGGGNIKKLYLPAVGNWFPLMRVLEQYSGELASAVAVEFADVELVVALFAIRK